MNSCIINGVKNFTEHLHIPYNCLAGIYLLYRGECVANNTLFLADQLTGLENGLQCVMTRSESPNRTAADLEGRWLYPNGSPVTCVNSNSSVVNKTSRFTCSVSTNPNHVTLYNEQVHLNFSEAGTYFCCFSSHCGDNKSSLITARIDSEFETICIYMYKNRHIFLCT